MGKTLKQHIRNLTEKVTDAPTNETEAPSEEASAAKADFQAPVGKRRNLLKGAQLK